MLACQMEDTFLGTQYGLMINDDQMDLVTKATQSVLRCPSESKEWSNMGMEQENPENT